MKLQYWYSRSRMKTRRQVDTENQAPNEKKWYVLFHQPPFFFWIRLGNISSFSTVTVPPCLLLDSWHRVPGCLPSEEPSMVKTSNRMRNQYSGGLTFKQFAFFPFWKWLAVLIFILKWFKYKSYSLLLKKFHRNIYYDGNK